MFKYFLYKFGLFIIHRVPRSWSYHCARWLSGRHFACSRKDRDAVIHNLQQIMQTKADVSKQAREVFLNFGRYLVDFFLMYKTVDEQFVRENVIKTGEENLKKAFARGKGVIFLAAHIGNWEMGAAVLARMGLPVVAIALPHKERKVNELFNRQREHQGLIVVPANIAVRRCIEALRRNQCVALLGDRDFGAFGEPLSFLGRATLIPKGPAYFACRTGAAIVPSFLLPLGDGRYQLFFDAPIEPPVGVKDDDRQAMIALMKQYVAAIERKIHAYPTQWLMFREFGIEYEDLRSHSRLQRNARTRSAR